MLALVIRHEIRILSAVICGLSGYTMFCHIMSQMARFSGTYLLNKMCVCLRFLWNIRLKHFSCWEIRVFSEIWMYMGVRVKWPLFLLDYYNQTWKSLNRLSKKSSNIKFHENPSSGSHLFPADGRTDTTKLFAVLPTPLTTLSYCCYYSRKVTLTTQSLVCILVQSKFPKDPPQIKHMDGSPPVCIILIRFWKCPLDCFFSNILSTRSELQHSRLLS
jgi:hypothetical protein